MDRRRFGLVMGEYHWRYKHDCDEGTPMQCSDSFLFGLLHDISKF